MATGELGEERRRRGVERGDVGVGERTVGGEGEAEAAAELELDAERQRGRGGGGDGGRGRGGGAGAPELGAPGGAGR